jgi:Rod binding domain-containing protein
VIDPISLPADVRNASPQDKALYEASLQFESILTEQLTQELDPANQDTGDDSSAPGYGQMLPGAFAQGLTNAGGLGLADELYRSFKVGS